VPARAIWRPLRRRRRELVPALGLACALLVAACGGDGGTGTRSTAAGNPADRAFAAQMIVHHASAVEMAAIARRRSASAFVKPLADAIVRTQTAEIATMRAADRRLRHAGVKRGSLGVPRHMMGMDADASALERARAVDRAFLRMMIPHHEGAIVMARAELRNGADPELQRLARSIIGAQQREIGAMRRHLGGAGGGGMHGGGMHGGGVHDGGVHDGGVHDGGMHGGGMRGGGRSG
jgi:uncharacterized protein (DUF305 family)